MKKTFSFTTRKGTKYEGSFLINKNTNEISELEIYCPQHDHLGEIEREFPKMNFFDCSFVWENPLEISILPFFDGSGDVMLKVTEKQPIEIFSQKI